MPEQIGLNSFGALGVFALVWGVAVTAFWMVCGWRAMRAHERMADAVEKLVRN